MKFSDFRQAAALRGRLGAYGIALPLRRGARGASVVELQKALYRAGFENYGPGGTAQVDGIFGEFTEMMVGQLQASAGLPVTGVVDQATWAVLAQGGAAAQPAAIAAEESGYTTRPVTPTAALAPPTGAANGNGKQGFPWFAVGVGGAILAGVAWWAYKQDAGKLAGTDDEDDEEGGGGGRDWVVFLNKIEAEHVERRDFDSDAEWAQVQKQGYAWAVGENAPGYMPDDPTSNTYHAKKSDAKSDAKGRAEEAEGEGYNVIRDFEGFAKSPCDLGLGTCGRKHASRASSHRPPGRKALSGGAADARAIFKDCAGECRGGTDYKGCMASCLREAHGK